MCNNSRFSDRSCPPLTCRRSTVANCCRAVVFRRFRVRMLNRRLVVPTDLCGFSSISPENSSLTADRERPKVDGGTVCGRLLIDFFTMAQLHLVIQDLLVIDASRTHSDTPHGVGLLWTSDQPDGDTTTGQHTTFTIDKTSMPRRDMNSQSQQAIGRTGTP